MSWAGAAACCMIGSGLLVPGHAALQSRVVAKREWATPVTLVCSSQEPCVLPLGTQNWIETSDLIKSRRLDSTRPLRVLPQLAFWLCL